MSVGWKKRRNKERREEDKGKNGKDKLNVSSQKRGALYFPRFSVWEGKRDKRQRKEMEGKLSLVGNIVFFLPLCPPLHRSFRACGNLFFPVVLYTDDNGGEKWKERKDKIWVVKGTEEIGKRKEKIVTKENREGKYFKVVSHRERCNN